MYGNERSYQDEEVTGERRNDGGPHDVLEADVSNWDENCKFQIGTDLQIEKTSVTQDTCDTIPRMSAKARLQEMFRVFLRRAMLRQGMNQTKFADFVGIQRSNFSSLVTGARMIRLSHLEEVLDKTGMDLEEMLRIMSEIEYEFRHPTVRGAPLPGGSRGAVRADEADRLRRKLEDADEEEEEER